MYLRAVSIGYVVPSESFDASVHSAFQSSLNLRLNTVNRLLTLTGSSDDDLPQGIRLDAPKDFTFEEFQTGEPVSCRDGILSFENSSLTIQLLGARRWQCNLPSLEFDITNPAISAAWTLVWEALNKRQRLSESEIVAEDLFRLGKSAGGTVSRKAGEAMQNLLDSTRRYELTEATAVQELIGLGPGLTPSGDDLLVGYMAGLWCTLQDKGERMQFISSLGKTIIRLSRKTNDISRTYMAHAVRGQVSSRLAHLAEAISRGENHERLLDIAETAMRVGHTSGMDGVTGLLAGLMAWEGDHFFSI
jgi:hypothetical protein